jgi:thiamine-monophosphate kinase
MLDVSDGLARDLRRVASASGVGVALDEVAVADGATLEDALGGGEDYELVLTHPHPDAAFAAFAARGLRAPVRIGTVVDRPGTVTLDGEALADVGWRH